MASEAPRGDGAPVFSMLQRAFGDDEMAAIFSETATVEAWLRTEAALARSQASLGILSPERAAAIVLACRLEVIDLAALWRDSANVGYPILPLVRQVDAALPPSERGSVHYGATTQDIMDTGLSLQLERAVERLVALTRALGDALAVAAEEHAETVMAGRTHGQQAVPTTLGAKLATYLWQCRDLLHDLERVRPRVCVLSLHGAGGTSASFGDDADRLRAAVASELGLGVPDGTWHVRRDGLADFGAVCSRAAAVCSRLAREIIDLSRTEIGELRESAGHHRGASSTMPQKANPIDSEAVVGLATSAVAVAGSLYRAMEAGHERAAGEWHVEWHAIPQTAVLTAGALLVSARVVAGLQVDRERMLANLGQEQGRTLAEGYMFQLAPKLGREAAHDLVYEAALVSKERGIDLDAALRQLADDPDAITTLDAGDHLGQAPADARAAVEAWRGGDSDG